MERIVRVWIGHEYLEYELELPDDYEGTEDELFEDVVNDVYNTLSVEILW